MTVNETWILHYILQELKKQSKQWIEKEHVSKEGKNGSIVRVVRGHHFFAIRKTSSTLTTLEQGRTQSRGNNYAHLLGRFDVVLKKKTISFVEEKIALSS